MRLITLTAATAVAVVATVTTVTAVTTATTATTVTTQPLRLSSHLEKQMDLPEKDWAVTHRPTRFDEVRGQEYAVRLLSQLVLRRTRGRHLLLHGAVGSGKTTLARIFARALNCDRIDSTGSPCGECLNCENIGEYYLEFDVAGKSGDKERIGALLGSFARAPRTGVRVLFFDEAHALTPAAQDSLLKSIEDAADGLVFCLGTSEADGLKEALRSRLWDVHVSPLGIADAVALLESVAIKENVKFEKQALYLLASVKPPFARNLVLGLEQLAGLGDRVDVPLVERTFDLDVRKHLGRYARALASGDRDGQTIAMREWPDDIAAKVDWLVRLLTSTYYNNVLGQSVIVDPLVHTMDGSQAEFVAALCERLNIQEPRELAPHFETMLDFWLRDIAGSEEVHFARLSLFEALLNDGLSEIVRKRTDTPYRPHLTELDSSPARMNAFEWQRGGLADSEYLEREHGEKIINRASFFWQHYGKCFNSAFKIDLTIGGDRSTGESVTAIEKFAREIEALSSGEDFAAIVQMEREGWSVVGRIVSHISFETLDPNALNELCSSWNRVPGVYVGSSTASAKLTQFHWREVFKLCAGIRDDKPRGGVDLRARLKIARDHWRNPNPLSGPKLLLSPTLSDESVRLACDFFVEPLSALDAGAWAWIKRGWESKEHLDRKETIVERRRARDELGKRLRSEPEQLKEAIERLEQQWSSLSAEQRRREHFQGWWLS